MPPRARHRILTALATVAATAALAACGQTPTGGTPPPNMGAAHRALLDGPPDRVQVATVGRLGSVLTTGQGLTLYVYAPDRGAGTSTCYGICASEWPPLLLPKGTDAALVGAGAEPGLIGRTTRTDGTVQVTYGGWPLYRWIGDEEPGQATGQGIYNAGGLWWVIHPDGRVKRG